MSFQRVCKSVQLKMAAHTHTYTLDRFAVQRYGQWNRIQGKLRHGASAHTWHLTISWLTHLPCFRSRVARHEWMWGWSDQSSCYFSFIFSYNFRGFVGQAAGGPASNWEFSKFVLGGELEKAQRQTFVHPLLPWNHTSQLPRPQSYGCVFLREKGALLLVPLFQQTHTHAEKDDSTSTVSSLACQDI